MLALLEVLPDVIVRADAAAAAVIAVTPLTVMLADARAPAVLAGAPVCGGYAGRCSRPQRAALRLSTARVFYTMLCKDVAIICHIYSIHV